MNSIIAHTVDFCTRRVWVIVVAAAILGSASAAYVARHFAIDTDVTKLLSPDLPWRQRELAYAAAFPQQSESIVAVVEGATPELAGAAAEALSDRLSQQSTLFRSVAIPGGGEFFERNGLLYLPTDELSQLTRGFAEAAPLVEVLVEDASLRGLAETITLALQGVGAGHITMDDLARPLNMAADTLDSALSGTMATFSWRVLLKGAPAAPEDLRRIIEVWPVLDYEALEPGRAPTEAIREAVRQARLGSDFASTVQLTGPVPIADQEFATLQEGALLNGIVTGALVIAILWLTLRSARIVAAVIGTLIVGLAVTAALGLILVGALNPISVAFAVLFVGLGADFAIQFGVRYRVERHANDDLRQSLINAAVRVGPPLTLAAAAAAAGFLSFLPTNYTGLAQLGLISGFGMAVAYLASMTLLPALLCVFHPPSEPRSLEIPALAPADRFLQRHRIAVVAATLILALAGLPALRHLQFDFNPLSLKAPDSEAVAALNRLSSDPKFGINAAQVLASPDQVAAISQRLSALAQVAQTRSLDSFVPDDQERKLELIREAASALEPALKTPAVPAPSDEEDVAALRDAAKNLQEMAGAGSGDGAAAARRLAGDLTKLAEAPATMRRSAAAAFLQPLERDLEELRQSLQAQSVTRATLPASLVRAWTAPDGRERVEALPKGDPNDSETLRQFALAVLAVQPTATGQAIDTYEWGRAIIIAFGQAAFLTLCSITIMLLLVLRRIGDVLLTIVPLLVAGAVTLEICALTDFALNYANIIALPVLLGIGVAFKIYYVMAWRQGELNFLRSALTRAVFFSALMTGTAFGSLWLSGHPGTSSMGKLLALCLLCTLASAALFQPALMGRPRAGGN